MKKLKTPIVIVIVALLACYYFFGNENKVYAEQSKNKKTILKDSLWDGDIIFHSSSSEQCKAVQIATNSIYSHCGIIFKTGNDYNVLEAVQPVIITPLNEWIKRGNDGKYVIRRLIKADSVITDDVRRKMVETGKSFLGKNYDLTFEWSDDRIYCSELVWKIYKRAANIEVGKLQSLKSFNLQDKRVQKIMKERYGNNIPYDEQVISPVAIFKSDLLKTVAEN